MTVVRIGAPLAACVMLWILVALTFIDFDTQLLPDNLTLPLLWAGLLANVLGVVPGVNLRDATRFVGSCGSLRRSPRPSAAG